MNGINLKKCLVCKAPKTSKGLFCASHVNTVADGMALAGPKPADRAKLKSEAEQRLAALQARKP